MVTRLSIQDIDTYDPATRRLRSRAKIFLDGEPQLNVIEADIVQGYIIRYKLGEDGRLLVKDGELVEERIQGVVEIIDPYTQPIGQLATTQPGA